MTPFDSKSAQELRDEWPVRALVEAKGTLLAVVVVVLAQEWPTILPVLLRVAFREFRDLKRPFLTGYAHVWTNGSVLCHAMFDDGKRLIKIFDTAEQMNREVRDLADKLKLSDRDRGELFRIVKRWVVRDHRINVNGVRLAS